MYEQTFQMNSVKYYDKIIEHTHSTNKCFCGRKTSSTAVAYYIPWKHTDTHEFVQLGIIHII